MGLIACNECEKKVSEKAEACPHCGAPAAQLSAPSSNEGAAQEKSSVGASTIAVIILLVGAGYYWIFFSDGASDAAVEEGRATYGDTPLGASLKKYATQLVTNSDGMLLNHRPPVWTSDTPTYALTFVTNSADLLTERFVGENQVAYQRNLQITKRWQDMFCTSELKQILEDQNIFMVMGQLADSEGEKHSMALCVVER